MTRLCRLDRCEKPHYANGLCRGHYDRQREGKPVDVPLRRMRPWTEAEDQVLLEHYHTQGYKVCAKMLDRSEKSIFPRARRLGIAGARPAPEPETFDNPPYLNGWGYA